MARKDDDEIFLIEEVFGNDKNPPKRTRKKKSTLPQTPFEQSLATFNCKSVVPSCTKKRKRKFPIYGLIRYIAVVICLSIFLGSLYKIIEYEVDTKMSENMYSELRLRFEATNLSEIARQKQLAQGTQLYDLWSLLGSDKANTDFTEPEKLDYIENMITNLSTLKELNKDLYGWIKIDALGIDYPILIGDDNMFYLTHTFDGSVLKAGSIFADYRLSPSHDSNLNVVIYGHCMNNGTMFGSIKNNFYKNPDREAIAQTMEIEIYTLKGLYIYELFSFYRSDGVHFITTNFHDEDDYYKFLKDIKAKSIFKRDVKYSAKSRIVTLSTCTNSVSNPEERFVTHGILKSFIPF